MEIAKFENEIISIENVSDHPTVFVSDDEINAKYTSGEIRIVTEQARYPLDTICSMLESGKYILHPDFQRRRRWDRATQSRLIESFIMNIPIPPIFLYEYEYSKYEVMDGLQRLTAISEFYKGLYPLEGLDYWKELNGRTYNELPEDVRNGIDRRYLSSLILLKETARTKEKADEMKQLVFDRINSGGVKLEYQESRNALYPGKFNSLAVSLSRNEYFCKIFDIPFDPNVKTDEETEDLANNAMYRTMADVELVVRFFAMRYLDLYEGISLRTFFDKYTEAANKLSDDVILSYRKLFEQTIKLVYDIYGNDAFCLYKQVASREQWYLSRNPTKTIYDPVMSVMSQHLDEAAILVVKKEEVKEATIELMRNLPELFNGRKGTKTDISKRIDAFDDMIKSILQC